MTYTVPVYDVHAELCTLADKALSAGFKLDAVRLSRTAFEMLRMYNAHAASALSISESMMTTWYDLPISYEVSPGELAKMENTDESEIDALEYYVICLVGKDSRGRLVYFDWVRPKPPSFWSRLADLWRKVWS